MVPHEADGRVVRAAYETYRRALVTGSLGALDAFGFAPRFLATGRDLADYVMRSGVASVWRSNAAIVGGFGHDAVRERFDLDDIACLAGLAHDVAFTGMAFQKFAVLRRVRPEELGGLLERDRARMAGRSFAGFRFTSFDGRAVEIH